jgi:hypothetical protein
MKILRKFYNQGEARAFAMEKSYDRTLYLIKKVDKYILNIHYVSDSPDYEQQGKIIGIYKNGRIEA